jgi:hypothetical protein
MQHSAMLLCRWIPLGGLISAERHNLGGFPATNYQLTKRRLKR